MKLLGRLNNKQGTSLVEILIALVIFLVGILSVVRMFPGGFFVVKHSENVTLANRLSQSEIERWKSMAVNLPGGILPWGWNDAGGGAFTVLPNLDPEDLRNVASFPLGTALPAGVSPYYYTDVNRFRRIYSESTRIPSPLPTSWASGCVYVLAFSPIAWNGPNDSILVYSGPLTRRSTWRGIPRIRSYSQYGIDYENGKIYLRKPPRYPRQYVISYSYWSRDNALANGRPTLVSVINETIVVDANTAKAVPDTTDLVAVDIPAPGGQNLVTVSGYVGIDHGSDSLHRKFEELPPDPPIPWDSRDPYEYVIMDGVVGVIAFNPHGYGYEEQTARGKQPLIAYIDYNVLDWHIIREERKLPDVVTGRGDVDFKLTLRFIKKRTEPGRSVEYDGTPYDGLSYLPPYNYLNYDMLAVDLETGVVCHEGSMIPVPTGPDEPAFTIDYKEGIVRFNKVLAGRTFRVYYKADGDWAVQPFKAFDVYRRSYNAALDHRQYFIDINNYNQLCFARCYAGSTVAVDYAYRVGNDPIVYPVRGDTFRISDDTGGFGNHPYVDVTDRVARLRGVDKGAVTLTEITKVYGVTLGTRVIWRETGRGSQAGRWKSVNMETYLTRGQ